MSSILAELWSSIVEFALEWARGFRRGILFQPVGVTFRMTPRHAREMRALNCADPTCHGCRMPLRLGERIQMVRVPIVLGATLPVTLRASICMWCVKNYSGAVEESIREHAREKSAAARVGMQTPGCIIWEHPWEHP